MADVVIVEIEKQSSVVAEQDTVLVVEVGMQGPPGRDGTGAAHVHEQASASATWTINHNLGYRPAVALTDTGGNAISADVQHMSLNQTVVSFVTPTAGFARLN